MWIYKSLFLWWLTASIKASEDKLIIAPSSCTTKSALLASFFKVDCEQQNLTNIPDILFNHSKKPSYFKIKLDNNLIKTVPANLYTQIFRQSTGNQTTTALCATTLLLSENQILEIEDGAFEAEPGCLTTLDLSKNKLESNSINQISKITALEKLNLESNFFPHIEKNLFTNFKNLEHLDLAACKIQTIDANSFSNLENLSELRLDKNLITNFQPNTFHGLYKLEFLDISFLPVETYVEEVFNGLPSDLNIFRFTFANITGQRYENGIPSNSLMILDNVNFHRDELVEAGCAGFISYFSSLYEWRAENYSLETCGSLLPTCPGHIFCYGLSEFPKVVFHPKERAQLSISFSVVLGNNISEIPKNLFSERLVYQHGNDVGPLNVFTLELPSNNIAQIHDLAFVEEPGNLKVLDLSYNNFTEIPGNALFNLRNVTALKLKGNTFYEIKSHSFKQMPTLNSLDLEQCNIKFIEQDAFDGLTSLEDLYLTENNLTSFPTPEFLGLPTHTSIYY